MRVSFGDCTFDGETRELFRGGRPVHLSPKAFRLLELLLENRPRALSKAEIHEKIWPDAFVSEATLASLVAEIREGVGEGGKGARYVRTVHGFGYSFSGAVLDSPREVPTAGVSSWRLILDDRVVPLPEGETILGRDPAAGIRIPSESVSRRHARITVARGSATLEDLASKNGTFLGEEKIAGARPLRHGDVVRLGSVKLLLRLEPEGESTRTEIEQRPPDKTTALARPPRRRGPGGRGRISQ